MSFQQNLEYVRETLSGQCKFFTGEDQVIVTEKSSAKGLTSVNRVIDFQYREARGVIDPLKNVFLVEEDEKGHWKQAAAALSAAGYKHGSNPVLRKNYGITKEYTEKIF